MTPTKPLASSALDEPGMPTAPLPGAELPPSLSPLVVTEFEAAQMLRVSPRTLQRLRLAGGGPPYVPLTPGGARIGYPVADLQAWLASRTVASTSAAAVAAKAGAL